MKNNKRTPQITIKTNGVFSEITVDGKKLEGVRGYSLSHDASGIPQLQISLKASDVTVETIMIPELPELFSGFYVSRQELIDNNLVTEEQLDSM